LARALGVLGLAFALIVISCVLAAWLLEQRLAPSLADVRQQLAANFVLLVFGLSAFLAFVCLARSAQGAYRTYPPVAHADRLVFAERGQTLIILLQDVEWIESQGNYQAVRADGVTHLVRRTLNDLQADLPSERFVRIHRGAIVSIGFVQAVSALSNGDAVVVMADGRRLRLARGRRAGLAAALSAGGARNT
jgi:DNA-binding LytR/AlgR family response regulator